LHLVLDDTRGVDLDESGRAGLGDQGSSVGEALEGMDLDTFAAIAIAGGGVVLPDELLVGAEFDDLGPAFLEEDVSVGQHPGVMDGADGMFPLDPAVGPRMAMRLVESSAPSTRRGGPVCSAGVLNARSAAVAAIQVQERSRNEGRMRGELGKR
jgi:hypothetical protein